jgi:hypothetical protein
MANLSVTYADLRSAASQLRSRERQIGSVPSAQRTFRVEAAPTRITFE